MVIDEQHRFGVEQRTHLVKSTKKGKVAPHVLTMTATPIPRTVALTLFGDLELSTLNELPKGRQKITTWVVGPEKREAGYKWVYDKIKKDKIQAFVVCPLIEESDKETMTQVKAATAEYENIKRRFPNLKIGLLHGKMKARQKDHVIDMFRKGDTEMLVSTAAADAVTILEQIEVTRRYVTDDVQALSRRLHPTVLYDLGLPEALRSEAERFSADHSLVVERQLENAPSGLSPEVALCLYRVAQESLRNVARHAQASRVEISLTRQRDNIELAVRDNGKGFSPEAARARGGLGLISLRERLHLVGGRLTVISAPGRGTTVLAWAPIGKETS